jgi:outer membrane protein insertion porin family
MRISLMPFRLIAAVWVAVVGVSLWGPGFVSPAAAQTIRSIQVEGNHRIEAETVRSYMQIAPGEAYSAEKVDASLKVLFRTGLFSDVRISRRNDVLVVVVEENPIINRVSFEGNRELDDDALAKEVELRPRVVFTRARAQADAQRIVALYRRSGRFSATVEPKIIQLSQNRVDLVYEINDGPVTKIERINFVGNRAFSDSQLRGVIATSETRWWKFLTSSDSYDPDRLNYDRELLRRHYLKNGYADFRVLSSTAELARDGKSFFITFSVEEGPEYSFGPSTVATSVPSLDVDRLQDSIRSQEGRTYDATDVDKSVENLTIEAGKEGFAFAEVKPRADRDEEGRTIAVVYEIEEGPRVYIERIEIVGNVRTLDKVIRREIRLSEGDAYNRVLVDRARRRITGLDFFAKVDIKELPGSAPDKVIMVVEVEEKSTGSLAFGAGFSTAETILGDITLTERNLLGRGQYVRLRTSMSFKRQQVDFSFTEPYFLDRNMSFGVDLYATETDLQNESSFDTRQIGAGFRFGFPLSEDAKVTLRYSFTNDRISDVKSTASVAILAAAGTSNTSLVGYAINYDTLDSPIEPTSGVRATFAQDLAGLGGDVYFLRTSVKGEYYYSLFDGVVGLLGGSAGYTTGWNGEDVRILDRFFKGGESFRGFERSGIGPRDVSTSNQDAVGGQAFAIGTAEVTFPVGLPEEFGVRGAVFTDVGTLFDSPSAPAGTIIKGSDAALRASVGVGILWKSPLGPVRFDLAEAILKESYDKTELFRFSIGTRF